MSVESSLRSGKGPVGTGGGGVEDDAGDAELVAAVLAGDMRGFAELYGRHVGGVAALCRKRLRHRELAQDVTHEAFAVALAGLAQLRDADRFGGWVRTIAANLCSREALGGSAPTRLVIDLRDDVSDSPERSAERRESIAGVRSALAQLGPSDRELLELRHLDELSLSEVAGRRSLTYGAAEVATARARKRLRAMCDHLQVRPLALVVAWRAAVPRVQRSEVHAAAALAAVAVPAMLVAASLLGSGVEREPPDDPATQVADATVADWRPVDRPRDRSKSVGDTRGDVVTPPAVASGGGDREEASSRLGRGLLEVPHVTVSDRPPAGEPESFAAVAVVVVGGQPYQTGVAGGAHDVAPAGPCPVRGRRDVASHDGGVVGAGVEVRTSPC